MYVNSLQSFHFVENISFDIMHDLFEGVCSYDICQVLLSLIKEKVLTLETINSKKRLFPYGEMELSNMSANITIGCLQKNKLKMTASEMICFATYLPLMIGDLIPPGNRFWDLVIVLSKTVDLLLVDQFEEEDIHTLTTLIESHHTIYIDLYGDLKPKHHFMVHYPRAIRQCGPLKFMWAMRYEAKHKEMKIYTHSITSRLNIEKTISIKSAYKFASCLVQHSKGLPKPFDPDEFKITDITNHYLHRILAHVLYNLNLKTVLLAHTIVYKNTKYKQKNYLGILEKHVITFFKIIFFILCENEVLVICSKLRESSFDEHFVSYELKHIKEDTLEVFNINKFTSKPMEIFYINNGKSYLKYKPI
ncbi:uncharacterized protein LOC118752243 [Rhagoletis pomonella]|uniref:uncharacterized protein LOC118752243 n=1 Tax=Rhagoletis pomonella TaxID=28610 RepID=UPI00177FADBD|nr:uncharacterized protein LOC118752243 [Rhagoletis pomonella]XP_036342991.1 uncharacterized protein LOC118752243 [Rhagoletis pomonella]